MEVVEDGGAAFPLTAGPDFSHGMNSGMTLRDWFAGKAMQAAATNPAGADGFTLPNVPSGPICKRMQ